MFLIVFHHVFQCLLVPSSVLIKPEIQLLKSKYTKSFQVQYDNNYGTKNVIRKVIIYHDDDQFLYYAIFNVTKVLVKVLWVDTTNEQGS